MSDASIEPTRQQLETLMASTDDGPVIMLNLLRYRDLAADDTGRTGREAYAEYGAAVAPMVLALGGGFEYVGATSPTVIGPADEQWDDIVLVKYPNRAVFVTMITSPEYLAVTGHRTAALADSRLVPTTPLSI